MARRSGAARRPRIADVAKIAGVSVGTVSNVLNRPGEVSDALRGRVEAAIDELGFVRNGMASTLAAGVSRNIGLVVLSFTNSLFVDVSQGAQEVANTAGLNLLMADSSDDPEVQERHVQFFDEARLAGVLIAPMEDSTAQIRRLAAHGRPAVVLNFEPPRNDVCSVVIDNEQAGFLAATHLIERGATNIVFLGGGGTGDHFQPVRLRRDGVRRAVAQAGVDVRFEELDSADLNEPSGRRVAQALLSRGPRTRPDGIIGVTDGLAAGALEEFVAAGVRVPDELLVIGCDHNTSVWGGPVALSTVAMRGVDMGRAAMRLLLDELGYPEGGHAHQRVVLEPHLVEKASTAR